MRSQAFSRIRTFPTLDFGVPDPSLKLGWAEAGNAKRLQLHDRRGNLAMLARTRHKSHWHGRANWHMQISWQAHNFRKVRYRFRSRRSTFTRSSANLWQARHFRKVKYRLCGRHSALSHGHDASVVAGAALSQGQVQIPLQAHTLTLGSLRINKCKQGYKDTR